MRRVFGPVRARTRPRHGEYLDPGVETVRLSRAPLAPDVPTIAESGYAGFKTEGAFSEPTAATEASEVPNAPELQRDCRRRQH